MSEVNHMVKFNFHGDELDVVKDGDNLWISVRRVCEALGLGFGSQTQKLKEKVWAGVTMIVTPDARGHNQTAFMLDLDSLPMWLATIDTNRVAEDVRPKLEAYQKEAAKALRNYFFEGYAVDEKRWRVRKIEEEILIQRHKAVIECADALSRGNLFRREFLQRKVEHSLAIMGGDEVSDNSAVLIDVSSYLMSKGLTSREVRHVQSLFGRIIKSLYIDKHGQEPGKCMRFVNGSDRMVNSYTEDDFPIFDEAWEILLNRKPTFANTYTQRMEDEDLKN